MGRSISAMFLSSLWLLYVVMSTLQAYGKAGLDKVSVGSMAKEDLPDSAKYWMKKCGKWEDA